MKFNNPKIWRFVFYFFTIFPMIFVLSLLAFYFHTGYILGHLPIQSMNDPKNYSIYSFYAPIIVWSFGVAFCLFFIWILTVISYCVFNKNKIDRKPILITLGLYIAMIGLFFSDITVWFGD